MPNTTYLFFANLSPGAKHCRKREREREGDSQRVLGLLIRNTRQRIIPLSTNHLASTLPLASMHPLSIIHFRLLKQKKKEKEKENHHKEPQSLDASKPRTKKRTILGELSETDRRSKSEQVSDVSRLLEACQRELDGFRFIDNLYRRCC